MKIITLIAALTLTASANAPMWGETGHRVTGAIAEKYLTPAAQKAIRDIIGVETLAEAAYWPDEMRSSPEHFWQKVAGPYHYVTVPEGKTYDEVGAPKQGDAIFALAKFRAQLLDPNSTLAEKQLALRFTAHLIGDLHQPLHAGNGNDRGGNDIKLTYFWDETNLHSVWDRGMINGQVLSFSEWTTWLSARITPELLVEWSDPNPRTWVAESIVLRDTLYPQTKTLSYDYKFKHLPTVKRRLSMAGVRMAAYFNDIYK